MCVVVCVELLLLLLSYCRRGTGHVWVGVGAELLLLYDYCCCGNRHVCVAVGVELLMCGGVSPCN